jgi:glycosyltransferase involved in cell wall biosynthesis
LKRDIKEKIMISGIILARNEESNIVDCIKSLRPHVSEVILIDMESSDATIELARPIVDKLLRHELISNFDSARNIAVPEASNEWLWFVDADERIPEQTGELVNNIVRDQGKEFEAISIPFKTHFCGKWIEHSGWWPGYTMPRVLKKGHFRFAERLHGGVETDGREVRLAPDPGLSIEHFSYRSIEHYIDKINRYTTT